MAGFLTTYYYDLLKAILSAHRENWATLTSDSTALSVSTDEITIPKPQVKVTLPIVAPVIAHSKSAEVSAPPAIKTQSTCVKFSGTSHTLSPSSQTLSVEVTSKRDKAAEKDKITSAIVPNEPVSEAPRKNSSVPTNSPICTAELRSGFFELKSKNLRIIQV